MSRPGHVIGLNLSREGNGKPPLTIDGTPFQFVGEVYVSADPNTKSMRVTVEFHASHITGVDAPAVALAEWLPRSTTLPLADSAQGLKAAADIEKAAQGLNAAAEQMTKETP